MMVVLNNISVILFCFSERIGDKMKNFPPYCYDLFDDETSEDEFVDEKEDPSNDGVKVEEDQSNDVVCDNIIEVDDDDSDCSDDEDKGTSDSKVDN